MKAVVVGAGVAGSSAAIALCRLGAEVTVLEAYADPGGTVGSFLSLATNGLRGLDVLGCLEPVQQVGFAVDRQHMLRGDGKLLADVARGRVQEDPMHSVTLRRADLVAVLRAEAFRAGARIHTGMRVTDPGDPRLTDADLVVGADGIWSATRGMIDPGAPRPTYGGLYYVSGISSRPALRSGLQPGMFEMILARRGAFIYLPAPDGSIWWSAQVAAPNEPDLGAIEPDTLQQVFATEPHAVAILKSTRATTSSTLNHVLAEVPRRHDDRTVLIGDAAHPVGTGQGASMAIEDAVVLAQQLDRSPTVGDALRGFDAARQRRLGKMARMATRNRDAKTAGPIATALRNLVMPLTFSRIYPRATGWLYTHDLGALPSSTATAGPSRASDETVLDQHRA